MHFFLLPLHANDENRFLLFVLLAAMQMSSVASVCVRAGKLCVLLCLDPQGVPGCVKLLVYLSTGGVASAGPRGGSLRGAVRALRRQPAAAVCVAEALAVLFADLREQTAEHSHVCWLNERPWLKS